MLILSAFLMRNTNIVRIMLLLSYIVPRNIDKMAMNFLYPPIKLSFRQAHSRSDVRKIPRAPAKISKG